MDPHPEVEAHVTAKMAALKFTSGHRMTAAEIQTKLDKVQEIRITLLKKQTKAEKEGKVSLANAYETQRIRLSRMTANLRKKGRSRGLGVDQESESEHESEDEELEAQKESEDHESPEESSKQTTESDKPKDTGAEGQTSDGSPSNDIDMGTDSKEEDTSDGSPSNDEDGDISMAESELPQSPRFKGKGRAIDVDNMIDDLGDVETDPEQTLQHNTAHKFLLGMLDEELSNIPANSYKDIMHTVVELVQQAKLVNPKTPANMKFILQNHAAYDPNAGDLVKQYRPQRTRSEIGTIGIKLSLMVLRSLPLNKTADIRAIGIHPSMSALRTQLYQFVTPEVAANTLINIFGGQLHANIKNVTDISKMHGNRNGQGCFLVATGDSHRKVVPHFGANPRPSAKALAQSPYHLAIVAWAPLSEVRKFFQDTLLEVSHLCHNRACF
jgi:hypothetical protein